MNIIFFTCIFVIEQVYQNKLSTKETKNASITLSFYLKFLTEVSHVHTLTLPTPLGLVLLALHWVV